MKRLAVYDFDGTLISADSLWLMMRSTHSLPSIIMALLRCSTSIILSKLGLYNSSLAKEQLLRTLYGQRWTSERFTQAAKALLPQLQQCENQPIVQALDHDVADKNCTVVIATASLIDWIQPWAHIHSVDHLIATEYDINNGHYIGLNCHGEEKARRVRDLIATLGNDFNTITVYTDTPQGSDKPLTTLQTAHH